jgi:hypothetical protein
VHVHHILVIASPRHHAERLALLQDAIAQQSLRLDAASLPHLAARLACGRFADVHRLLRQEAASADAAVLAIALGRCVAWSGEIHTADALRPLLASAVDELAGRPLDDPLLHAAACANLERLASDLGDPQLSARARAAGRSALHAVGGAPTPGDRLLARAWGINPPPAPVGDTRDAADDVAAPTAGMADALELLRFVHETLGAEPDATRHRLRLQPLPEPLHVTQLPFADGAISLDVGVAPAQVTCRIEQESGAIPITVLLEPRLASTPLRAWVDGQLAELQPRQHPGGGIVVPVQLVLDAARTLRLDLA